MRLKHLSLLMGVVLVAGCTTPRPKTLKSQRAQLEQRQPQSPRDWSRLGWWRLMDDDSKAAASAFTQAGDDPLAALGRAALARDRLDSASTFSESLRAMEEGGRIGEIARHWATQARRVLPSTHASERPSVSLPRSLVSDGHVFGVSYLNHLSLRRLHTEGITSDDGREVEVLGRTRSVVSTPGPVDPDALNLSRFSFETGPVRVRIKVSGHFLVIGGSGVLHRSDLTRPPPGHGVFVIPEGGPIWVAWSGKGPPKLSIEAVVEENAISGRKPSDGKGTIDWLNRYIMAQWALENHDGEMARRMLVGAPTGRLFQWARARAALSEWGVPASIRRKRALEAIEKLKPSARLHFQLAKLRQRMGDQLEAEVHLRKAIAHSPTAFALHRERLRLLIASGRRAEARRVLEYVGPLSPGTCALLDERMALRPTKSAKLDGLIRDLTHCGRAEDAAAFLLERGFPERSLKVLGDLAPTQRVQGMTVDCLVALDRIPEAMAALASQDGLSAKLRLHDMSSGSREKLRRLLRARPDEDLSLELFSMDTTLFPAPKDRFDTERVIKEFEGSNLGIGPATRVLDHNLVWMTENGQMVRWIHEIIAIGSREAARFYGEANLPIGGRPLMLYTRKADGRRLYTEELAEKESLSFPDLEVGDYLVAQYLQVTDNGYLYDKGFMTPRVWFQGVDMPIFLQRFSVYAPGEAPLEVESFMGAPPGQSVARQGGKGLQFEARVVERRPAEQRAPDPVFWLPSVRVGRNISLKRDLEWFREQVLRKRMRSGRFDDWVQGAIGQSDDPVLAISRKVRETIDAEVGLIAESITQSIQTGHGNRGLVMSGALEAMGVEHTLVLARPKIQTEQESFTQVADFQYPLIRLEDGRWLDPGPARAPVGFIPFVYLGGDALVLWPPGNESTIQMPEVRRVEDGRRIEVQMHWAKDGTIEGRVLDTITGQEAIVVGNALGSRTPEERMQLVQYLFAGVVPAARITELDESATREPDAPLVMRYAFKAKMNQRLSMGLFPVRPGRNFAALQKRTTDLQVELPVNQTLELVVTGDVPFTMQGKGGSWQAAGARYESRLDHDDDRLTVRTQMHIDGGLLKNSEYAEFARWAREVGVAEQLILTRLLQ